MARQFAKFEIRGNVSKIHRADRVTILDIASNKRRKVNDQWEDDTHWNTVKVFGKWRELADLLEVGNEVIITGTLRNSSYKDADNNTRYTVDLIAGEITRTDRSFRTAKPEHDDQDHED